MPIKASYCNDWYDACKDDTICEGVTKSYFEIKDCQALNAKNKNTLGCKKFSDVYADAEHMCVAMWDNSFTYEEDESKGYTMAFPEGTINPNNLVFTDRNYPATCVNHTVNVTHPHVDAITGERVTAEDAGCAVNWHLMADSGHPLNGTVAKPEKSAVDRAVDHYMVYAFFKLTGYAVGTFNSAEQLAFKKGVATFAMVNSIDVNITSMAAVSDGVGVDFTVRVSDTSGAIAATTAIGKTPETTMTTVFKISGLTTVKNVTRTTATYANAPPAPPPPPSPPLAPPPPVVSGATSGFSTVAVFAAVLTSAAVMLLA